MVAIGGIGSVQTRDVEAQRTPVSQADIRGAIQRAFTKITGQAPSASTLDALTAQASLETGRGGKMYNYNFGGIKGSSPEGSTAHYMTREVVNGQSVHLQQGFRAYSTLDQGAEDYVRLLTKRYGSAVQAAGAGNIDGFAHALKQAGYYTASETDYAKALHALSDGSSATTDGSGLAKKDYASVSSLSNDGLASLVAGGGNTAGGVPTAIELERVMDALNSSALRIASPSDDDA